MAEPRYNKGDVVLIWVPYSKDPNNGLLGSIVSVKLEEWRGDKWKCYIRLSGKPTAATAKGTILYVTEDEFFNNSMDLIEARMDRYEEYLQVQAAYMLKNWGKVYNVTED